jgi:branched-chain amino acid transport system permease protein
MRTGESGSTLRTDDKRRPPAGRGRWRPVWPILWGGLLVALVVVGFTLDNLAILSVLTTVFMSVMLAQAWNILGGYGGYLNLGMAAFFGVGAYAAGILYNLFGWSPLATAVLGGAGAVLLAVAIGVPSLRIRGVYFAILTLVLTFLMQRLAFNVPLTQGALGIFLPPMGMDPRRVEQTFYMIFLALAVISIVVAALVEHSRFGYALEAIREDEDAAEILGVRTNRTKMNAFAIGAFMAGVAGAVFASRVAFIDPDAAFDVSISVNPVLMATYGGAGTWQGPIIGAPLVVILGEVLRVTFGGLGIFGRTGVPAEASRLVFGAVLIVVALFARQGVMGVIRPKGGTRLKV